MRGGACFGAGFCGSQGRAGVGAVLPWELCSAGAEGAPGRAAPCLALGALPGPAKLCLAPEHPAAAKLPSGVS